MASKKQKKQDRATSEKPPFKIIVAGSRNYSDKDFIYERLDWVIQRIKNTHEVTIISGCARGVDSIAISYAQDRGYLLERFPANWAEYGKRAGYIRNAEMADVADGLVAFNKNNSKGASMMISLAQKKGLKVFSYDV